jgi:hypothetical protein
MKDRRSILRTTGISLTGLGSIKSVASKSQDNSTERFDSEMSNAVEIGQEEGINAYRDYIDSKGYNHKEKSFTSQNDIFTSQNSIFGLLTKQPGYCVDPVKCNSNIDIDFSLVYDQDRELFFHTYFIKYEYGWANRLGRGRTDYPDDPDDYPPLWRNAVYDQYIGPRRPYDILAISWKNDDELIPASTPNCNARRNFTCAVNIPNEYATLQTGSYTGEGLAIGIDGYHAVWDNGRSGPNDTATTSSIGAGIRFEKGPEFKPYTRLSGKFVYAWKGSNSEVTVGYPASISYKRDGFKKKQEFQHTKGNSPQERRSFDIRVSEVM